MNIAVSEESVSRGALTAPEEFMRRARELAPILRERAERCDQMRRVPDETVADFKRAGLIRSTQPARFGGAEAAWDTLCEVSQILAAACGSQAWIQRIMADHAQMVSTFPAQAQEDVWASNNDALVSASFDPVGKAERVEGGFVVNGRHGFASGLDHADWMIFGGYIHENGRRDGPHFFLAPKHDAIVIDDWKTMGLAGTGSKSFELKKVFVPEHRFLDGRLANRGAGPGTAVNRSYVYRIPRGSGVTTTGFTALAVGMAKGVLNEWIALTAPRKSRGQSIAILQTTQETLARSAGEIEAAEILYLTTLRKALDQVRRGEEITPIERATAKRNVSLAAQFCLTAATRLFNAAGGRALFLDSALQRQYRNLLGAVSHHALSWDSAAIEFGKLALEANGAPASEPPRVV